MGEMREIINSFGNQNTQYVFQIVILSWVGGERGTIREQVWMGQARAVIPVEWSRRSSLSTDIAANTQGKSVPHGDLGTEVLRGVVVMLGEQEGNQ